MAGSERPRDAEAPWLSKRGAEAVLLSAAPPIDLPLPAKALKPAAAELLLAAVEAVELDSAAELSEAEAEEPPPRPMKPEEGKIVPPMESPVETKYERSW